MKAHTPKKVPNITLPQMAGGWASWLEALAQKTLRERDQGWDFLASDKFNGIVRLPLSRLEDMRIWRETAAALGERRLPLRGFAESGLKRQFDALSSLHPEIEIISETRTASGKRTKNATTRSTSFLRLCGGYREFLGWLPLSYLPDVLDFDTDVQIEFPVPELPQEAASFVSPTDEAQLQAAVEALHQGLDAHDRSLKKILKRQEGVLKKLEAFA